MHIDTGESFLSPHSTRYHSCWIHATLRNRHANRLSTQYFQDMNYEKSQKIAKKTSKMLVLSRDYQICLISESSKKFHQCHWTKLFLAWNAVIKVFYFYWDAKLIKLIIAISNYHWSTKKILDRFRCSFWDTCGTPTSFTEYGFGSPRTCRVAKSSKCLP